MADAIPQKADHFANTSKIPSHTIPEDEDKVQITLEQRILNIVGKEILEKAYKPTSYAMAVLKSGGDPDQIVYQYAKIRYNDLHERAIRRIKNNSETKI